MANGGERLKRLSQDMKVRQTVNNNSAVTLY